MKQIKVLECSTHTTRCAYVPVVNFQKTELSENAAVTRRKGQRNCRQIPAELHSTPSINHPSSTGKQHRCGSDMCDCFPGTITNPGPRRSIPALVYLRALLYAPELVWACLGAVWVSDESKGCDPATVGAVIAAVVAR